jgi:hypothetical protein
MALISTPPDFPTPPDTGFTSFSPAVMGAPLDPYAIEAKKGLTYTSPSGKVFNPYYQVIPYEVQRRNKEFTFIDVPGTYIQDNGMESGTFALKMYFVGMEHHLESEAFLDALKEYGPALVNTPLGLRDFVVIPTEIKMEVDHVDAMNQTVFEVRFKETTQSYSQTRRTKGFAKQGETLYTDEPISQAVEAPPETEPVSKKRQTFVSRGVEAFKNKLKGVAGKGSSIGLVKSLTAGAKTALNFAGEIQGYVAIGMEEFEALRELQTSLITKFDSAVASIDSGASDLFETPLIMATQIQAMLSLPNFSQSTNLLNNYKNFLGMCERSPKSYGEGVSDYLQVQTLFGTCAIGAVATKVLEAEYDTRQEAVDALAEVKRMYDQFMEYLEGQEVATSSLPLTQRFEVDSEVQESLYELIQRVSGGIDELIYGLRQTVIFTVDYPTTPLNLAAKHYPALFAKDMNGALTFFEQTNGLSADELFVLERGREYKVLI